MRKFLFLSLLLLILMPGCNDQSAPEATHEVPASNAYKMELLDRNDTAFATLTVWVPEFVPTEVPKRQATSVLVTHISTSTGEEIQAFNARVPKSGVDMVEIESFRNKEVGRPPEECDICYRINLNPGAYDHNIDVYIDFKGSKIDCLGSWLWQSASGGDYGGDVKVTRIHAEQAGPSNGDKPSN